MSKNVQKNGQTHSTPVTILWDRILMLPIFGMIDSARAQDIMRTMLEKILDENAKVIILDILGVATVDSAVANHLIKITKACKLMGCQAIITGISSEIAQSLVALGVELGEVLTTGTLKDGLEGAFEKVGLEVVKAKKN